MKKLDVLFLVLLVGQLLALPVVATTPMEDKLSFNKLLLTSDASGEMETMLVELNVRYDVAVAQQDFEVMARLLYDMGVVYYNFNYPNIAKDYIRNSKEVAEKYGVTNQQLLSLALLSKIEVKTGRFESSLNYNEEYAKIINSLPVILDPIDYGNQKVGNTKLAENNSIEDDIHESTASTFPVSVVITFLGLSILLIVVVHYPKFEYKNRERLEKTEVAIVKKSSEKLLDIDINMESLNLIDFDEMSFYADELPVVEAELKEKIVVQEIVPEIAKEFIPDVKPKIEIVKPDLEIEELVEPKPTFEKPIPISAEVIRSVRKSELFEKSNSDKLPLWVSGLEHYFKNVNLLNGIRFDFNFTGNFISVPKTIHSTFSGFLKVFTEELLENNNVGSISAMLVNTGNVLVMQIVIQPIDRNEVVFTKELVTYFDSLVHESLNCTVDFSDSLNGESKLVLKGGLQKESIKV